MYLPGAACTSLSFAAERCNPLAPVAVPRAGLSSVPIGASLLERIEKRAVRSSCGDLVHRHGGSLAGPAALHVHAHVLTTPAHDPIPAAAAVDVVAAPAAVHDVVARA